MTANLVARRWSDARGRFVATDGVGDRPNMVAKVTTRRGDDRDEDQEGRGHRRLRPEAFVAGVESE